MTCPSTATKLNYNFDGTQYKKDGTLCDPFTLHMTQCTCISFPLTPQLEMIYFLKHMARRIHGWETKSVVPTICVYITGAIDCSENQSAFSYC